MQVFRYLRAPIVSAAAVLALCTSVGAHEFTGKCVAVLDGDTIDVMHDGLPERIRLASIDCPEKAQPFGMRAKQFTAALAFGQQVTVTTQKKDRYSRTIGDVTLPGGQDLNEELVRSGFAWQYRQYSSDAHLAQLEDQARQSHLGLWADPEPVPPWEFRHTLRAHAKPRERNGVL